MLNPSISAILTQNASISVFVSQNTSISAFHARNAFLSVFHLFHKLLKHTAQLINRLIIALTDIICHAAADMTAEKHLVEAVQRTCCG